MLNLANDCMLYYSATVLSKILIREAFPRTKHSNNSRFVIIDSVYMFESHIIYWNHTLTFRCGPVFEYLAAMKNPEDTKIVSPAYSCAYVNLPPELSIIAPAIYGTSS